MKRSFVSIVLVAAASILLCGQSPAQKHAYEEPYIAAIEYQLQSTLGLNFGVAAIVVVDSLRGRDLGNLTMSDFCFIEDPYNTLQGCVLFAAAPDDDFRHDEDEMIGVFRNGSVIWHSDTLMWGQAIEFAGTQDINRDGTVDIMVVWTTANFDGEGEATMWIYSWNGSQGTAIHDTVDIGYSVIGGNAYGLQIVDLDGDGIMEIRDSKVADGSVVYSWNGQKYGRWPSTPHVPPNTFPPARNAEGDMGCKVVRSSGNYVFNYEVISRPTSTRKVQDFYIIHGSNDTLTASPSGWRFIGSGPDYPLYGFWALGKSTEMIPPGGRQAGFAVTSNGLPKIVPFYLRSERLIPDADSIPNYPQAFWQDVFTNSYVGNTISPYSPPPPAPFVSVALTDTLLSYTSRSRALNWILDQTTADKYTGIFTRVRADLDAENKTMALLRLDSVLAQIGPDSAAHFTDEAYALLRYNTEYLVSVIPEDPLPIQLWYFWAYVLADGRVEVEWGTLTETNNFGFYVQKSRNATSGFSDIPGSFVPGHGTTLEPHEYTYREQTPGAGVWYYRLKQVDYDATMHYTDAVQVYIPQGQTEVANFTAIVLTDNSVRCDWETLRETNNAGFEVQTSRYADSAYTTISESFTPGQGTTTELYYYSYTDKNTSSGLWYYRLKQIDADGTPHYLEPEAVIVPDVQIEVEGFSASTSPQQTVQLSWATPWETGNARFAVQVSRGDSTRFHPIAHAVIEGHGTTTTRHAYFYRDRRPTAGVWYYRLKQYNVDGRVRYTRHIRVNVQ
jgi:hypothetical protein